jgi:hypothetical protein
MTINMTQIAQMTYEQYLLNAHKTIAVPELILLFACVFILFFIIGMILIKGGQSKMKFIGVWVLSLVLSFMLLMFFVFMPTTIQNIINFFTGLFH